jgi:EAL domain-containing protein (putative c-di-GMP-specific phosphodiesterase class I)
VIFPHDFICIAEETGLIIPIGEFAFKTACEQLAAWKNVPSLQNLSIAVNLSAKQFKSPYLEQTLMSNLKRTECNANLLEIEITESTLIPEVKKSIGILNNLKTIGVKILIDDFGTGYSSLSQLKNLPIDKIKIDQSFVSEITDSDFFIETIINLAQKLNLVVISEGVETEYQASFLKEKSCQEFQGYLYSKPLPLEEFEKFVIEYNGEKENEVK